jgi:hypothetical protein
VRAGIILEREASRALIAVGNEAMKRGHGSRRRFGNYVR